MDLALQLLFTGVGIGAVYALVALGFVLIFRATNVVNFAQGEFVMLPAFFILAAMNAGAPFWLAALFGIALAVVVLGLLFKLVITQRKSPEITTNFNKKRFHFVYISTDSEKRSFNSLPRSLDFVLRSE